MSLNSWQLTVIEPCYYWSLLCDVVQSGTGSYGLLKIVAMKKQHTTLLETAATKAALVHGFT